jgi:deoxyribodipyrimidine photo-lyase
MRKPVAVFLAPVPFYSNANLRHYRFLAEGMADIAAGALAKRNNGFVLRRFPEPSLLLLCDEVKAALVMGDENLSPSPRPTSRRPTRKLS